MKLPSGTNLLVLASSIFALLIPAILLEYPLLRETNGNIVFPLDSAYIDITVARNLAFERVWGISKHAFQPAAASLLYPMVLAPVFFIFGGHLIIPLIVNSLTAIYLLFRVQRTLIRAGLRSGIQLLILLLTILAGLLPLLIVSGTGSILQLLLLFLFAESLASSLRDAEKPPPRRLYLYGALMIAAGYANGILLIGSCLLLILLRRRPQAIKLFLVSLTPAILFGAFCLIKRYPFLPVSLLAASYPGPLIHFQRDCIRIYEREYPLAAFVHRYYRRAGVGVDDIGAVAWFSDGRKLDLTGVTHTDAHCADSLCRGVGIRAAIIANPWFSPAQFPRWQPIASWKIAASSHAAATTLKFFAIEQYDTTILRKHLKDYQPLLPRSIEVQYY